MRLEFPFELRLLLVIAQIGIADIMDGAGGWLQDDFADAVLLRLDCRHRHLTVLVVRLVARS